MSTAVWLAVLVGLWAVVLLPYVRDSRHSVAGLRSIDHFHSAMRVLSRRDDRNRRLVVLPPGARTGRVGLPVGNNTLPRSGLSVTQRRARTFAVVVATALVSTGLAVGLSSGLWIGVAAASWLAFGLAIVWLRGCARAAARERRQRRRAVAPVVAPAWSPATGPFAVVAPSAAALATLPRPAGAPEISQTLPVVQPAAEEWQEWPEEPFTGVRVLDLTTPGGWRRRRLFESSEEPVELGGPEEVPIRSRRTG